MHTVNFVQAHVQKDLNETTGRFDKVTYTPAHWDVGFWFAKLVWHNVESFDDKEKAYCFCNYLNGGNELPDTFWLTPEDRQNPLKSVKTKNIATGRPI